MYTDIIAMKWETATHCVLTIGKSHLYIVQATPGGETFRMHITQTLEDTAQTISRETVKNRHFILSRFTNHTMKAGLDNRPRSGWNGWNGQVAPGSYRGSNEPVLMFFVVDYLPGGGVIGRLTGDLRNIKESAANEMARVIAATHLFSGSISQ